jgi:hypothetical protein
MKCTVGCSCGYSSYVVSATVSRFSKLVACGDCQSAVLLFGMDTKRPMLTMGIQS